MFSPSILYQEKLLSSMAFPSRALSGLHTANSSWQTRVGKCLQTRSVTRQTRVKSQQRYNLQHGRRSA